MPDRTSELADDYAEMQKLYSRVVDGEWYLVERKNGRRWIEEVELLSLDDLRQYHSVSGDKITLVEIFRKS